MVAVELRSTTKNFIGARGNSMGVSTFNRVDPSKVGKQEVVFLYATAWLEIQCFQRPYSDPYCWLSFAS